ncbi:MAG: hypothetical protein ABW278_01720 [Steroidobacteraceae bacterium]
MKPLAIVLAAFASAVALSLPAAETGCDRDRACLAQVMDGYLQALLKHDATQLATTRNVKYTENGVRIAMGDGLWQTASAMPTYRLDVIDEEEGQVGLLGRISENGNNNWYGVRLRVEPDRKVSEIEVLVNRSISSAAPGPAGGAPPRQNSAPHPLMAEVIPAAKRLPRGELARISDTYFTGIDTELTSRGVPFSPQCQRRENGTITANNPDAPKGSMAWFDCKTQFDTGFQVIVTDIRERRFEVVDRTTGLAFGWGYFDHNGTPARMSRTPDHEMVDVAPTFRQPFSFYIAEVFKVVDGQIRQIEAVLTTVPYQMESGW